jgi:hypothetical protein
MGSKYRKTRVISQDMKTGQFAYLDQLIKDGYYPNLWVLPENDEPPLRSGQSIRLPIEPIINFSPPNILDSTVIPLGALTDVRTGIALSPLVSYGAVGEVTCIIG